MNRDEFDQQIRAALEAERSPEQLARLEVFWHRRSRAERRRRRIRHAAALAAAVTVTATLAVWQWGQEPAGEPHKATRPTPIAPDAPGRNAIGPPQRAPTAPPPSKQRYSSTGRRPTPYERFLFTVQTRGPAGPARSCVAAAVDEAIERLVRDPEADPAQLAESSGLMECDAERLLLRRLSRSTDEQKHAVVRLLAVCGTRQSTPALLRLGRREAFRDDALATVQRIVGVGRLAELIGRTTDRRVRAELMDRLLRADSEAALRGYLALVHQEAVRAEALAAADAAGQPLLAGLLARLEDEDKSVRMAAAVVLGHVNGPEVTRSLIARVTQEEPSPTEAWIALLACRGERAEQFFAYATRDPQLLGQVNRARVQWARMIP